MATVTASSVGTGDSLETFRQQFNSLRSDVSGLSFDSTIIFEGATANDFETTFSVTDPTADRTITFPDKTDTVALLSDLGDKVLLNATDSSGTDAGDELILNGTDSESSNANDKVLFEDATGDHLENPAVRVEVDVLLETSTFAKADFLLDERDGDRIEYESATNDVLLGALFLPPAGGGPQFTMPTSDGVANQILGTDGSGNLSFINQSSGLSLNNDGNNRVITATGANSGNGEANLLFDGSTLTVTGNITATTITLSNDSGLIVPDDGNLGSASATDAIQISSAGIVTFKDDIKIKDGGTIGTASDADAITIAAAGAVTFSQRDVHSSGITIADGGQIGSASDLNAITISSGGVVAITATTANTSASDGALTVAGGAGIAADLSVGDDLRLISDDAVLSFGADSEIALTHNHNVGLKITSTANAPLSRRSEDVFIVLNGTDASSSNAGDNIIIEDGGTDGGGTNAGDDILGEDEVFLMANMQRNVIEIRDSGGALLNSVAGFAPGAA